MMYTFRRCGKFAKRPREAAGSLGKAAAARLPAPPQCEKKPAFGLRSPASLARQRRKRHGSARGERFAAFSFPEEAPQYLREQREGVLLKACDLQSERSSTLFSETEQLRRRNHGRASDPRGRVSGKCRAVIFAPF